jgi:hypothetical protein
MNARGMTRILLGVSIALAPAGSINGQDRKVTEARKATAPTPNSAPETMERSVAKLVEQLKRHPVQPKQAPDRHGLYLFDIKNEDVTLIADQPAPGLTRCTTPEWSHDGRRILFDATPGIAWGRSRLWSIEAGEGRPIVLDVGAGGNPSFSPADDLIAFNSNAPGVESGVWTMHADGSNHRFLGDYGRPIWSPDGRQLMVMSFGIVKPVRLMDADPEKSEPLQFPGHQIYSNPSWVGAGTIVAVIGPDVRLEGQITGDTIALIDLSDPPQAKVKEVLWQKANANDLKPSFSVYSATLGRCIFVGTGDKGAALYSVQRGKKDPPKRLGPDVYVPLIGNLAASPDDRYLVYGVQGPDWPRAGVAPGVRGAVKADQKASD